MRFLPHIIVCTWNVFEFFVLNSNKIKINFHFSFLVLFTVQLRFVSFHSVVSLNFLTTQCYVLNAQHSMLPHTEFTRKLLFPHLPFKKNKAALNVIAFRTQIEFHSKWMNFLYANKIFFHFNVLVSNCSVWFNIYKIIKN